MQCAEAVCVPEYFKYVNRHGTCQLFGSTILQQHRHKQQHTPMAICQKLIAVRKIRARELSRKGPYFTTFVNTYNNVYTDLMYVVSVVGAV